jgi:flavin-dependent dehydrogenase
MPANAKVATMTATPHRRGAEMDDVIVVGGRCAGAATALLLARAGLSVRLLERCSQLGDVVSGHLIKPAGVARLQAWGLLDTIIDAGTPLLRERVLWVDGRPTVAADAPATPPTLAPRRPILDSVLLHAAARAGTAVELGVAVTGVVRDADRVTGVTTAAGNRYARLVIGADGRNSRIARSVGAAFTGRIPAATYAYYTYWRGTDVTELHASLERHLFIGMFPTNHDRTLVFYQAPAATFDRARQDPMGCYLSTLQGRAVVRELLGSGTIAERLRGIRDLPTFFRVSAGPGWALVGDAGHHKDPLIARGIADAFRDADLLSSAVLEGWDGDLDAATRDYERRRDAAARPLAAANASLARLDADGPGLAVAWRQTAELEASLDPGPRVAADCSA